MTKENECFVVIVKRNSLLEGKRCNEPSNSCHDCLMRNKIRSNGTGDSCADTAKKYLENIKDEVEKLEILMAIHN